MSTEDPLYQRLLEAEITARKRLVQVQKNFTDPDVIRVANDLWLEAQSALAKYVAARVR